MIQHFPNLEAHCADHYEIQGGFYRLFHYAPDDVIGNFDQKKHIEEPEQRYRRPQQTEKGAEADRRVGSGRNHVLDQDENNGPDDIWRDDPFHHVHQKDADGLLPIAGHEAGDEEKERDVEKINENNPTPSPPLHSGNFC